MKKPLIALSVTQLMAGIIGLLGEPRQLRDKKEVSPTQAEIKLLQTAIEVSKLQVVSGLAHLQNSETPYTGWVKKTYGSGETGGKT